MRIAVGGLEHESCSFTPVEACLEDFLSDGRFFEPETILRRTGEANTIVDGFLRALRLLEVEIIPLVWSDAPSGGQPTIETYLNMKERLLVPLRAALPLDGVLLSLHGSFSVQGLDDADGDILEEARRIVGPDCAIFSVHDLHCNLSETMARNATAMIVEDTYPHVDMAERGMEAAQLLFRTLKGEIKPTMSWRPIPLFWAAKKMITSEEPMRTAMQQVFDLEKQPGVLTVSLGLGYQWADVSCAGASVVVVTDNDPTGAQKKADSLARWIWERKDMWQQPSLSPVQALEQGEELANYPIILADQADNPGGGAPGDSTEILRLFIERGLRDAAVLYVVDPETVQIAKSAGVGNQIEVQVGGKSHPLCGPPVPMHVEVCAVCDGRFVYDGPMWANLDGFVGDAVLLRQNGLYVVAITLRNQPVDLALTRALGLDCRKLRYISVKSTGHFRSGFGPIAGSIFNVDAAGVLSHDTTKLPFKRLGRKIYPNDIDAML